MDMNTCPVMRRTVIIGVMSSERLRGQLAEATRHARRDEQGREWMESPLGPDRSPHGPESGDARAVPRRAPRRRASGPS